jgi:hypothetical protein
VGFHRHILRWLIHVLYDNKNEQRLITSRIFLRTFGIGFNDTQIERKLRGKNMYINA